MCPFTPSIPVPARQKWHNRRCHFHRLRRPIRQVLWYLSIIITLGVHNVAENTFLVPKSPTPVQGGSQAIAFLQDDKAAQFFFFFFWTNCLYTGLFYTSPFQPWRCQTSLVCAIHYTWRDCGLWTISKVINFLFMIPMLLCYTTQWLMSCIANSNPSI